MNHHEYFKKNPIKLSKNETVKKSLTVGNNAVAFIRMDLGLTQAQMARKCGLQQPTISMIENCERIPSLPMLYRIVNKCGYELTLKVDKIIKE